MKKQTAPMFRICAAATFVLAFSGGIAQAQSRPPSSYQRALPAQPAQINGSQLQSFAKATVQVQKIGQQSQLALQSAKTNKARQSILSGIRGREIQAVKSNGLSLQQYNAIFQAVQKSPQLRTQVDGYMKSYAGK